MSEVVVDTEKLEYGLERGIRESDIPVFSDIEERYLLREAPCGLVSSGIHEWCNQEGLPSRLVISNPRLPFAPDTRHVFPLVGESNTDSTIVDAAYSQFLGYVGIRWNYESVSGEQAFPYEKIKVFKVSETDVLAGWLTSVATEFQKKKGLYKNDLGQDPAYGVLASSEPAVIHRTYSSIWDLANTERFVRPDRVVDDGRQLAKHIPKGAITVT